MLKKFIANLSILKPVFIKGYLFVFVCNILNEKKVKIRLLGVRLICKVFFLKFFFYGFEKIFGSFNTISI